MMRRLLSFLLLVLAAHASLAPAAAEETIQPLEPGSFERIIATGKGRPLVVMVWSLDCDYCEPSFDALAQAKRTRGLQVVTIATDRADDREAARLIGKKLARHGLSSHAWAFGTAPAERLRYDIDPKWRGEKPRSYWVDGNGHVRAYSGLISAEIVTRMLN